jgi:hypothetical protein
MGCGVIVQPSEGRDRYSTSVSNVTEFSTIGIPFYQKYPLYGGKGLDFLYFAEGIAIMDKKGHLTPEGLDGVKDLGGALQYEYIQRVLMLILFYTVLLFYIILLFKTGCEASQKGAIWMGLFCTSQPFFLSLPLILGLFFPFFFYNSV